MQHLAMDLRMLSRDLSHYLEHQVRVGFFGSGVGLSLILGFSIAYACYYLSSIAKVSRRLAWAPGLRAAGGFSWGRQQPVKPELPLQGQVAGVVLEATVLLPSCRPFPGI